MTDKHDLPIAVAASGGADSLFALLLLKDAGLSPIALHGIFFSHADPKKEYAAARAREQLFETCARLDLDCHFLDLRSEFQALVVRPFVQSYAVGLTPNPCALCNAKIKFGLLAQKARELGAGRLATGHYAKLEQTLQEAKWPVLLQGEDDTREQSYFLALVPVKDLTYALFPLGAMRKSRVLEILKTRNISVPVADESREICFVPNDDYRSFLPPMAEKLGITLPGPGLTLLPDGKYGHSHKGLWQYTEGQRRGLGVSWKEPVYVKGKDILENKLILGERSSLQSFSCLCTDINIIYPPKLWPETIYVKTRYRQAPKAARVEFVFKDADSEQGRAAVHEMLFSFAQDEGVIAPGQVAAVYIPWQSKGDLCDPLAEPAQLPVATALRLVAGGIIRQ